MYGDLSDTLGSGYHVNGGRNVWNRSGIKTRCTTEPDTLQLEREYWHSV